MPEKKISIGQAIDQIINALDSLELDARKTAIDAACSHLGIQPSICQTKLINAPALTREPISQVTPMSPLTSTIDIRTLKEQKQPESAQQMACIVAYYLQELAPGSERKNTVTASDLERYFKEANFKLPKKIKQVLIDAKTAGYFQPSQARGEYKINAVGYNLVAHNLPKKKAK
ncbi:MAG: hypothetical protein ABSG22_11275 [Sedimentisphaerales bacterium]|jgi:hypothetical protein